jgi:hypothetical protein
LLLLDVTWFCLVQKQLNKQIKEKELKMRREFFYVFCKMAKL